MIATGGWVKANKGSAAITAGNWVTRDVTVTGALAAVTQGFAVTQAKDLQGLVGVCMVDASAAATTVDVWLGGTVG